MNIFEETRNNKVKVKIFLVYNLKYFRLFRKFILLNKSLKFYVVVFRIIASSTSLRYL